MTIEHNSELKKTHFTKWYKEEGIQRFFVDFDDTLCPTRPLIGRIMSQVYTFLGKARPDVPIAIWEEEIKAINNRLFEKHGVNSERWNHVIDEIALKFPVTDEARQGAKDIFRLIYQTPLTMLEGAEEGLEFIKAVGLPIAIVTHAGQEWTRQK
jgi:phosphoglycolate phosphatase-like HAD superfamily hydrolase